jgi:hypothetical protein
MDFSQYTPEQLIGKKVLFEYGSSTAGTSRYICQIWWATKTMFQIKRGDSKKWLEDLKFSTKDGRDKSLNKGGCANWGYVSSCRLISDEDAYSLKKEWYENRKRKELKEEIIKRLELETDLIRLQTVVDTLSAVAENI